MIRPFLFIAAFAFVPMTLSANSNGPTAEETIRKAIDNICGDTWCEGDFQFRFDKVVLDAASNQAQVLFSMTPYLDETPLEDEATFSSATLAPDYNVKCVVKGFSTPETILQADGDLNWDFYLAMTDCVSSLEKSLQKL
jgi:hypothetical protein